MHELLAQAVFGRLAVQRCRNEERDHEEYE
jgi:hypothetical protein